MKPPRDITSHITLVTSFKHLLLWSNHSVRHNLYYNSRLCVTCSWKQPTPLPSNPVMKIGITVDSIHGTLLRYQKIRKAYKVITSLKGHSCSQSPRVFWSVPRHGALVLTKRRVSSGNEIAKKQGICLGKPSSEIFTILYKIRLTNNLY